eukprot:1128709-Rhodomonas_salina.4
MPSGALCLLVKRSGGRNKTDVTRDVCPSQNLEPRPAPGSEVVFFVRDASPCEASMFQSPSLGWNTQMHPSGQPHTREPNAGGACLS